VNDTRGAESGCVFRHQSSPGKAARFIQQGMARLGMKKLILKRLIERETEMQAAPVPRSLLRKYRVSIHLIQGRRVWTFSPLKRHPDTMVLYLHGGAYYGNMSRMHWRLVERLIDGSGAGFIVPDYPLAPQYVCEDAYRFLDAVYAGPITAHHAKRLIFMGDSAGGGLALGFAQKVCLENLRQPDEIILFSPWLDVSVSHRDIAGYEDGDTVLSRAELKTAGRTFAGDMHLKDSRLSPLYGDLSGLGIISVFTGTHELLHPDALRLRWMLEVQHRNFRFYEYPGMFHDWVLIPFLEETRDAIAKVIAFL